MDPWERRRRARKFNLILQACNAAFLVINEITAAEEEEEEEEDDNNEDDDDDATEDTSEQPEDFNAVEEETPPEPPDEDCHAVAVLAGGAAAVAPTSPRRAALLRERDDGEEEQQQQLAPVGEDYYEDVVDDEEQQEPTPRSKRRCFDHKGALDAINRDYLGPSPLFAGGQFNVFFRRVHGVPGMLGSLDCSHTKWKNCPKAWQGSYQGKEKTPTIVLESTCDFNLWFWHASFGHAGTLNDINILAMSPLMMAFDNGSFAETERQAGVVPYQISGEEFQEMFLLVDGIYPAYHRFVKTCPEPSTDAQRYFAAWQEGARKDIERAFGVLQACFQWIKRPLLEWNLQDIAEKACACLILHNMLVQDRVMGCEDPRVTYDPDHAGAEQDGIDTTAPTDLVDVQRRHSANNSIANEDVPEEMREIGRRVAANHWEANVVNRRRTETSDEHQRLHRALLDRYY
eukprot:Nitzschia sp. Nitz4//scaffold40_size135432//298//1969//NITZ4_003224-RA/size135432-augustus-gene-0.28-mRNA-1//-1//CDS//3329551159//628//frame0